LQLSGKTTTGAGYSQQCVTRKIDRVWDGSNYHGASLEAVVRLGRAKGYRIVGCCLAGSNAFFARDDLCGDLFLDPPTAEEHYEPTRFFLLFLPAGLGPKVGPYVDV